MAKKQATKSIAKPPEELKKDIHEMRERIWKLKADLAAGKVKNVREIKEIKKDIARSFTIMNTKKV